MNEAGMNEASEARASDPFWEATRERRLLLQWCGSCESPIHFPRSFCPTCLGDSLDWREASGLGVVHAFSVARKAAPRLRGFEDAGEYVFALIELEEGVRLMSNVVGCAPEAVAVDMPVELCWKDREDGTALPQFQPTQKRVSR